MSARAFPIRPSSAGAVLSVRNATISNSRSQSSRVTFVKLLVLATFLLCMSAPEALVYQVASDLNPFVGAVKLTLLGLAFAILVLCRGRKRHWAIAGPFGLLMGWAVVCWVVSGAEMLPARNLVSSFGGIVVLAALCAAADVLGGIQRLVRLLVWALIIGALTSVLLGVLGVQAMPGQLALWSQLELFHGIGLPSYMIAGCAGLIAWVLARYLSGPGVWVEASVLLLLVIPTLALLRAYLIGIVVSTMVAAFVAFKRSRRKRVAGRQTYHHGYKRLLFLMITTLVLGAAVYLMKSSTRLEGEELSGRQIIWPIQIASIIQHPVFGLGPFGDVQLLFFDEQLPQAGAAHSEYLAAAVCYGVPGLLLFCGAFYAVWRRILRYQAVSIEERTCRYAALLSLVGLSTTMIAENVIRDPRLFSLHLLFPALCLSAAALNRQKAAR